MTLWRECAPEQRWRQFPYSSVGLSEHYAGILFVGSTHAAEFIQSFGKQFEQLFQSFNVLDDAS
jgi:hypothetical protein